MSKKLWSKEGTSTSAAIEAFTVGRDREFDILLAEYDVQGSLAHTEMLLAVGLLSREDFAAIRGGLEEILAEIREGRFRIEPGVEDVHSQVEETLTQRVGEAGKKIHSGRSRNDQVALDIKLYLRAQVMLIKEETNRLFRQLIALSEEHKDKLLPGYTHLQIAMPSSFGLWFGAYAESLVDDLELLAAAYQVVNKNPLGSGAGYGSSFPLDRELTTKLLHFRTLNFNSVYAQMSRGKTEKTVAVALASVAATVGRLAMDCCLYINQNFGFISFPAELTTGSSIMPHKKNPDVFELIRARCNRVQSAPNELTLLLANLPSGYHRDLQLTKEIVFPAITEGLDCLRLTGLMLANIRISDRILADEKYRYLFSVEAVNRLVNRGIPFREAYRQVGNEIEKGEFRFDGDGKDLSVGSLRHTHTGSIGNLSNDRIVAEMDMVLQKFA
ncbi:MAG TPA: argininosuccinate lyase [Puia sp.]|nr:argininosuccinate lyase [Puia sp.]